MQRTTTLRQSLTPELVLDAYRQGYFPMADGKNGSIQFYFYEPRGIIPLDERFKVRKSLQQIIKKTRFEIRMDTAFEEVIRACSRHDKESDTQIWLSEEMIEIYCELHQRGVAHSVESWKDGMLQGGLYGLALGAAFCGESMFSRKPYASQVALVGLVEYLRKNSFTLLDSQMESDHLKQFGMYTVMQDEYLGMLREAMG
ncbi:MAG: leucyl/phenylalanyl-tRNA--protein transferase [bacterium]